MRISTELRQAVKLAPNRQYELAQVIGIHPSTLSGWISGAFGVRDGDPRVVRLAELLGVPRDRAFDEDLDYTNNIEIRSFRR